MWKKAKSTGSLIVQNVDSIFVAPDHRADNIWKRRLKRRIQTGDFGISLQSLLPKKLVPLPWKRQEVVNQVGDTLSTISVNETGESSEDLVKCSTIGLIDPDSLHLLAESLPTPITSCEENDMFDKFEAFLKSEKHSVEDNIMLQDLELPTAWADLDLCDAHFPVNSDVLTEDSPGFLSMVDLRKNLEKWKGESHLSENPHNETCNPGPSLLSFESHLATLRSLRSDRDGTDSTPKFTLADQTVTENADRVELCMGAHSSSPSTYLDKLEIQDIESGDTNTADPGAPLYQCPEEHNMCTATGSDVCSGCGKNLNNSGKTEVKKFVNKVSPENADCNNHSHGNAEKDPKGNKFFGVSNMVYQSSSLSLESHYSLHTRPDDTKSGTENTEKVNLQMKKEKSFLKGEDGYKLYKLFAMVEKAVKIKRMENMKKHILDNYRWRQTVLAELAKVAKGYYLNPMGPYRKKWKELRREIDQHSKHSLTDTRAKLATVSEFFPFFTYIIMVLQLILLVVMVFRGLADVDVTSRLMFQGNTRTFLGTETVDTWKEVNMWVGPSTRDLIDLGGILSMCMRDEHSLIMYGIAHNYSIDNTLGCCEVAARNTAATTTEEECRFLSRGVGRWQNVTCNSRIPGNNSVEHVLKPCCLDHRGSCSLLSNEHCRFLGGVFYLYGKEHCSQVNCPSSICQMGGISSHTYKPWLPSSYQWWRPILSLLYAHGVVHLLLVLIGEWLLMQQVERSAGWLRMIIIYILCGVSGGMCASVFSPYTPQVGTTAALMGSLGVIHMELIEGWKLIKRPWLELIKIYSILILAICSGTLPRISNAAIIIGFITGLLSAVAFLPYINLGLWSKKSRRAAVITSVFLLILVYFIIIYSFHKIQSLQFCEWCKNFDCVEYTTNMCTHTTAIA